jgi:7-carboxy-7-deazaguanine synthase (Cx14CxxC type)
MGYQVKEIYYSLQGEGAEAGRPAVFLRFAGCNLWSGRAADRRTATCRFCDTDFVGTDGPGGGRFADAGALAVAVAGQWPYDDAASRAARYVVVTGGEPALQVDDPLIRALKAEGFRIGIETNGTRSLPGGLDWICVSPKAGTALTQVAGDELKLVFPQRGAEPERFQHLAFRHFILQPLDNADRDRHTALAVQYCLANPRWRLGLQLHKVLGLP